MSDFYEVSNAELDAIDLPDVVLFHEAKVGDVAYTYEGGATDFAWVTDLESFDERGGEVPLVRKLWKLVAVDEIVLPDPYPTEDES